MLVLGHRWSSILRPRVLAEKRWHVVEVLRNGHVTEVVLEFVAPHGQPIDVVDS